jgi:hypothetical protein
MFTAKDVIRNANEGKGCLGKCDPNEPVFVLRAQDASAADLVEQWAIHARMIGATDKAHEADQIAEHMRRWPIRKNPD